MARARVIVGIGEALYAEYPDRAMPSGLAWLVALAAARLGHVATPVARLGQDRAGSSIKSEMRARGINIDHLQYDPDLATGKLVIRQIAGKLRRSLDENASFDNMQWDFDLSDLAQQADAVVFGGLARRYGQSQTTIDRFLVECHTAVRGFDLTNRPDTGLSRATTMAGLTNCDALIIDDGSLDVVAPGITSPPRHDDMVELMRQHELSFVVYCPDHEPLIVHGPESFHRGQIECPDEQHELAIVALLHGVLNGWKLSRSLEQAERIVQHVCAHRDEDIPAELLMHGD